MQIVIEIPDEMYQTVKDETYCGSLYEELKNGTPLPKGHGRLIDADALKNKIMYKDDVAYETWEELYDSVLEEIDNAPTAINELKPKKNETDAKYARINSMLFNYYENKREKSLRDAIRSIDCDPYMDIIVFYYRDRMMIEQIAESYKVDTSTIVRNKRRLCLAIYDSLYEE